MRTVEVLTFCFPAQENLSVTHRMYIDSIRCSGIGAGGGIGNLQWCSTWRSFIREEYVNIFSLNWIHGEVAVDSKNSEMALMCE